jgi:2,3-bisphosphoglycerate-independent phosphoglycerate mutase
MEKIKVKPLCLIILDGWGISKSMEGNAIMLAGTPNMDNFYKIYPNTQLNSSGESVGLPEGQMGNSEVGHLNIGAGRVVYQEFTRISRSIKDGNFFNNKVLESAAIKVKENNSCLHLMGLVSDGGVHSHIDHLKALIDLAVKNKVKKVHIHAFLDGRDVPPKSAIPYLKDLDDYLKKKDAGEIATVCGRYYSMDRDSRWDRTKKAYDALVYRKGESFHSAEELVDDSYKKGIDDEFVKPALVKVKDERCAKIKEGDSVIFFNFRPDRARQLTRSFISRDFDKFDRGDVPPDVYFVCMTQYSKEYDVPVAFPPVKIKNTFGEVLANKGLKQLRIAETEKYAHVTFFFNGGVEKANPGEDRILIPSPKVATYNLKPEMSAYGVTEKVLSKIAENIYDVIILNFANPDMVGHTGFLDAAIKAIEVVDECVGKIIDLLNKSGGLGIITADHGNAEEMVDSVECCPITAHSISRVPFIICSNKIKKLRGYDMNQAKSRVCENREFGALCDIVPTMLEILGIEKPAEMTGKSLIVN